MLDIRRRIVDLRGPGTAPGAVADEPITDSWFEQKTCRNCGAAIVTAYCGSCGQKAAKRFVWRDIRTETWDRVRLFELQVVRTLVRLIPSPGTVAREYIFGRRTVHMHPLKLLIATVAVLVLLLVTSQYFGVYADLGGDAVVKRMAQRVLAYSNWSFSLGIVATFATAWAVFRGRLGYNVIELAILAIYCQCIILAFVIVTLLPTLIWRTPDFILAHKAASQHYVPIVKTLIVAVAYRQFFVLEWRNDWPKLLLAAMLFTGVNWALLRVYASAILWLVSR